MTPRPALEQMKELLDVLDERSLDDLQQGCREGTYAGDIYDAPDDCQTLIAVTRGELRKARSLLVALADPALGSQEEKRFVPSDSDPSICGRCGGWPTDHFCEAPALGSQEEKRYVYVTEYGCYSDRGVGGVYVTPEAAMEDNPITPGILKKWPNAAWKACSYAEPGQEWANGADWDDHVTISRYELKVASLGSTPETEQQ